MSIASSSLAARMAQKYSVDPAMFSNALKATAFKQRNGSVLTEEQMMALLIVADQYGLNPFTREIYAFPDISGEIIPVVGVDGWSRIMNDHPAFDGIQFEYSPQLVLPHGAAVECHAWVECVIHRKDRAHPVRVREYLDEVFRPGVSAWLTHTKRCLRHKGMIQGGRIAFGFTGIYDLDEAEVIAKSIGSRKPGVQEQSVAVTPSQDKTAALLPEQMEPLLTRLAERAKRENVWSVAQEYVKGRFSGETLEFALAFLESSRLKRDSESETNIVPIDRAAKAIAGAALDEGKGSDRPLVDEDEPGQYFG